ncbi:hypothetical protein BH23ACT6_BH23ACT6_04870 [soil metagenome]
MQGGHTVEHCPWTGFPHCPPPQRRRSVHVKSVNADRVNAHPLPPSGVDLGTDHPRSDSPLDQFFAPGDAAVFGGQESRDIASFAHGHLQ